MLLPFIPIAAVVAAVRPGPRTAMNLAAWLTWPLAAWAQIEAFRRLLRFEARDFSVRVVEKKHD